MKDQFFPLWPLMVGCLTSYPRVGLHRDKCADAVGAANLVRMTFVLPQGIKETSIFINYDRETDIYPSTRTSSGGGRGRILG